MPPPSNILRYDDAIDTDSVSIREEPEFLRIVMPRLGGARKRSIWLYVGIAYGLMMMSINVAEARTVGDRIETIAGFAFVILIIALFVIARWRSHHIFEVSRNAFTIRTLLGRRETNVVTYRRDRVHNIHRAAGGTKLVMSIDGRDFLELNISLDKTVVDHVAAKLQEAVTRDLASVDHSAPYEITREDIARSELRQGRPLYILLAIMSAILLCITIVSFGAGLLLFIFIAPLVGFLLGTQKKDFWI